MSDKAATYNLSDVHEKLIDSTLPLVKSKFAQALTFIPCRIQGNRKKPPITHNRKRINLTHLQLPRFSSPELKMLAILLEDKLVVFDLDNVTDEQFVDYLANRLKQSPNQIEATLKKAYKVSSQQENRCSYWFRIDSFSKTQRKKLRKFDTQVGKGIVEFRTGKHYQVFAGIHPKGTIYINDGPLSKIQPLPSSLFQSLVAIHQTSPTKTKTPIKSPKLIANPNHIEETKNQYDIESNEEDDLSIELQRILFIQEIETAPPIEDRYDWMRLTFAMKIKAQQLSADDDYEWIYPSWVAWSAKAENTCDSDYEFRQNWDAFVSDGSVNVGTYHKYFTKREYHIENWGNPPVKPQDKPQRLKTFSSAVVQFREAYRLNELLPEASKRAVNMQHIVYVHERSAYFNIITRTEVTTKTLAKAFNLTEARFNKQLQKHICTVANLKSKPGAPLIFDEGEYSYLNSFKSKRNYTDREFTRCCALFFRIALRVLSKPDFIHFMNCLATILNNPGSKIMHSFILYSPVQGIGKSTILRPFIDYLQELAMPVDVDTLLDKWSDYLDGKLFLTLDDPNLVSYRQKKHFAGKIKNLIAPSSTITTVQERYHGAKSGLNCFFLCITTNNIDTLYLEQADRRYYVARARDFAPLPDEIFQEYNELYSKPEEESYALEGFDSVTMSDPNPAGLKDIIGAVQRWQPDNPQASYESLISQLLPYGLSELTLDMDEYDPAIYKPFSPAAPPRKTETFVEMTQVSLDPFFLQVNEIIGTPDIIFDFQLIEIWDTRTNETETQQMKNTLSEPVLPYELRSKAARTALMKKHGYKSFRFRVSQSGKKLWVHFYSIFDCPDHKKKATETEKSNLSKVQSMYKNLT